MCWKGFVFIKQWLATNSRHEYIYIYIFMWSVYIVNEDINGITKISHRFFFPTPFLFWQKKKSDKSGPKGPEATTFRRCKKKNKASITYYQGTFALQVPFQQLGVDPHDKPLEDTWRRKTPGRSMNGWLTYKNQPKSSMIMFFFNYLNRIQGVRFFFESR